jgi:hypothetical protein
MRDSSSPLVPQSYTTHGTLPDSVCFFDSQLSVEKGDVP